MTRELLQRRRAVTQADLQMKMEIEDWHGVADAAMDLREIDAALAVLPATLDPFATTTWPVGEIGPADVPQFTKRPD